MRITTVPSVSIASLVAALALGSPAPLFSQAPGPLVKVDFRALTADGKPITDLKASEITLKVGGKAREVRSVDPVSSGGAPATPAPANPPYATNVGGGATRTVLLVIDDESVMPGREQTLTAALTRIAAGVPAGDRVGLLSVRRGGANIPPSTDRTAIRAAVDSLRGQSSTETDEAFKCRTQITLQSLESILASAPADSPTTVIFMSASLSQPSEAMARMRPPSDLETRSDLCRLTTENFEKVGTAAAGSRAQLYVIQLVDGTTRSPSEAGPGIENVAGVAGVDTRRVTASGDTTVDRILAEMAATYTAAFEADPSDRAAAALPIELKVTRAGVNTIAPSRIRVAKAGAARAKPNARDMIRVAETFTDLPIRAAGFASRGADNKLKVIALFEPVDPAVKLNSAVIGLFGTDSNLKAQWTAQAADFARSPATAALTVAPGTYRMRVAAVDANGRAGTADYTLDANLTQAGPVQLSTLVIGAPVSGSFAPQLHFTSKDAAGAGYLEIYGVPQGSTVTVTLEVAPSEDAPAIGNVPAQVVPGDTPDMRRAVGGFSIENLSPGDHVMRAIVSVDGKAVGRAVRTFRKSAS